MSTDFSCEVCKKSPHQDGIALFRTGEKGPGVDPHWRCRDHLTMPIDPVVEVVCDALCPPTKESHDV